MDTSRDTIIFMEISNDPKKEKEEKVPGITLPGESADKPHKDTVSGVTPDQKSHLSGQSVFNVSKAFADNAVEEGAIVSDRRARHVSLTQSLGKAFNEWFSGTKETLSKIQKNTALFTEAEKSTVEKAESRKDVLEKAATHAHIAPKNDTPVVIEKVKTYKKDMLRATGQPLIVQEPAKGESGWKHVVPEKKTAPSIQQNPVVKTSPSPVVAASKEKVDVAPVVTKKTNAKLSDFPASKKAVATPPPLPSKTIYFKKSAPAPKPSGNAVAPIVTTYAKRETKDSVATPTSPSPQTQQERGEVTWTHTQESPSVPPHLPPKSESSVSHTKEQATPAQGGSDSSSRTDTNRAAASGRNARAEMEPEFRSAPLPQKAKQELTDMETKRDAPVSQEKEPAVHAKSARWYVIRGVILLVVIASGVALGITVKMQVTKDDTVPAVPSAPVLPVSSFTDTSVVETIPMTGAPTEFRETLFEMMTSMPAGITQIYPLVTEGVISRPATSREFLAFLRAGLGESAMRSLDEAFMVGSADNEPFLLLRASNFDLLFSGMLAWEDTIQEDLVPFFGTTLAAPAFRDVVRENTPARILYDEAGNEILIYSIIDRSLVVITSSTEALARIISEL